MPNQIVETEPLARVKSWSGVSIDGEFLSGLLSKGKIEIVLLKTFFAAGEAIEGTVFLELKEPVESKGVFVSLSSQESRQVYSGGKSRSQHYTRYWSTVPLDVEKEYPSGQRFEYSFRLVAPSLTVPFNPFSMLRKFVTKDNTPPTKKFKVEAKLEISRGLDVNTDRDITISYSGATSGNI